MASISMVLSCIVRFLGVIYRLVVLWCGIYRLCVLVCGKVTVIRRQCACNIVDLF